MRSWPDQANALTRDRARGRGLPVSASLRSGCDVVGDVAVAGQELADRVGRSEEVEALLSSRVPEPVEQQRGVVEVALVAGGVELHRQQVLR